MKSSLLLKQAFFLGVTRALKDAGFDKTAISLYTTPFANSFQAPEQHSQMNLGDIVGSGHSAWSPFASSLLKASALESRVDPRPSGEFRQAPSAAPAALPKPEGPLTTDGWITTGQTTKEPARNSPISLL